MWGLTLEREEIFAVIKSLVRTRRLLRDADDSLMLSPGSSKELAARIRASNEVEAAAFAEWENMVTDDVAPFLDDEHLGCLREDLTAWMHRLMREYGVEAALLLFPEDPRYERFLARVELLGFDFLPDRDPGVTVVRRDALLAFVTRMTSIQRRFFGNLLNTAHLMSVFTLDPAALQHVQQLITGQLLYLDTNVVYSILSLAGPREYLAARGVLDLSLRLGYRICVTPWTVTEMQESVRKAHSRLIHSHPTTRDLADLAAGVTDSDATEAFVRAFRRMHRDTGITVEDFVDLHGQVEVLLANEGIEVIAAHCEEIDESEEIDEQITVLEHARGGSEEKPRLVQEHDVKHRLLVERLRGPEKRQFANAGCMFLTNDNALMRYAYANRLGDGELPFASSLEEWADIVRNLYPRTADYDKTMTDLLDTPIFSSTTPVSAQEITDALARISAYERHPPTISARVLLDSAISVKAQDAQGVEQDSSAVTANERETLLEARVLESRELLEAERARHERSTAALNERLEGERQALSEAEQRAAALSEAAWMTSEAKAPGAQGARAESLPRRISDLTEQVARQGEVIARQGKVIQLLIAVVILIAGVAVLAVPLGTGWITGGWPLVCDIVVAGATFAGAYASRFGFKRTIAGVTSVATLLTIVAAVQAFVS